MKILIVGGLGYLGLPLARSLSVRAEVEILDNNLFGKFDDIELERIGIPLRLMDMRDVKPADVKEFDVVVVSCLPDYPEFTRSVGGGKYVEELNKVVESFTTRVVSVLPWQCPILYGTSPAFRSDTLVNQIVLSFAASKEYHLVRDPFSSVRFASLGDFIAALASEILNDQTSENHIATCDDVMPVIMLANMIQWEFGPEYRLNMTPEKKRQFEINSSISLHHRDSLMTFIREIKAGIEKGFAQELYDEKYDNERQYEAILSVAKYKGFWR